MARTWSISASESFFKEPDARMRIRSGSAASTSCVVSGTTSVDGCSASSRAWAWTISTGRVFPGSVPRRGLRSASQISPRLRIDVPLDHGEFRVDTHALAPDLVRGVAEAPRPQERAGPTVHLFERAPHVLGPRELQCGGVAPGLLEKAFGKLQ